VVAIYSNPEAEKLAYLGLYALQHRGQESAGIVTSNGMMLNMHKSMGLVADIFNEPTLTKLRGDGGRFVFAECAADHGAIE
jgi:amidophosphoribosyltransferase